MDLFNLTNSSKLLTISYLNSDSEEKELLKVDVTNSENFSFENDVTQHPVEAIKATDYDSISDNIKKKPKTYSITGTITDDPMDFSAFALSAIGGLAGGIVGGGKGAIITGATIKLGSQLLNSNAGLRSQKAFDALEKIHDNKTLLIIQSSLKKYDNMVMQRLKITRDPKTGRALSFNADFIQVNIATSQVIVVNKNNSSSVKAIEKNKRGNKVTADATGDTATKGASWAVDLAKLAGVVQ